MARVLSARGYDAFISYSHEQDAWLAARLQVGLERFAAAWYRPRALRVFRDTANLAASPRLWASIEEALAASAWFILLVSPPAAESEWVRREVTWWLANKSADRMLLVATRGRLAWDAAKGDWAAGIPVPPELRGAFASEPNWVDLTATRQERGRARVPDEFLATLAAPLRHVERDALIGEHLRQFRRAIRTAATAAVALLTLLAFAAAATVFAVRQRNAALTAERVAIAGEFAARSEQLTASNLPAALLLAVAAYQADQDPQSYAALLRAATVSPHLVRFLQASAPVTAMASTRDGQGLMVGTSDGHLEWFSLRTGQHEEVPGTRGAVTGLSVSDRGAAVATDGGQVVRWTPGAAHAVPLSGVQLPIAVAISPSGGRVAVLDSAAAYAGNTGLLMYSARGARRAVSLPASYYGAGFVTDDTLIVQDAAGGGSLLDAAHLRSTGSFRRPPSANSAFLFGESQDDGYLAARLVGGIEVWRAAAGSPVGYAGTNGIPGQNVTSVLIRQDGRQAAVVEGGTIYVSPVTRTPVTRTPGATGAVRLAGGSAASPVTFLGASGELASAADATISVWNTGSDSRIGADTGISLSGPASSGLLPTLAASGDGRWLLLGDSGATGVRLIRNGTWTARVVERGRWVLPVQDRGQLLIAGLGDMTGPGIAGVGGRVMRVPAACLRRYRQAPMAAGAVPAGDSLALADSSGYVAVCDVRTGTVRTLDSRVASPVLTPQQAVISPDGRAAVASVLPPGATTPSVTYVNLVTGEVRVIGGLAEGLAFGHGDDILIQRPDGSVEVWDPAGRRRTGLLYSLGPPTQPLAVSPDGALLARLRDDGTISLTDMSSGDVLVSFGSPIQPSTTLGDPWDATTMMFTPDGRRLFTATAGGHLLRWTIDPPDLIKSVCATVGGSLTAAQWRRYTDTAPPAQLPCAR